MAEHRVRQAGEGILHIAGAHGHVRAGIDDDAVVSVVLHDDGSKTGCGIARRFDEDDI